MNKLWLAVGASLLAGALAGPSAVAEPAKPTKRAASTSIPSWSPAARNKACKADCLPQNTHGMYKAYHRDDPTLMSDAAKKVYADCVKICLAPLPMWHFVQRPLLEAGGVWFGQNAADCLTCHVNGPGLKVPPGQRPLQASAPRRPSHR